MKTRVEIKSQAKALLLADYGACLLPYLLFAALSMLASGMTAGVGALLLLPFEVGVCLVYLLRWRGENPPLELLFISTIQENYLRKLCSLLLVGVYTFLWSLLFIIPGIVKSYSYAMTGYILAKYPNVNAQNAIKLSGRIMEGRKLDLFVVDLSFIGWNLLGVITFGVVQILWVAPYMLITKAGCFDEYLADALANGRISEAELNPMQ